MTVWGSRKYKGGGHLVGDRVKITLRSEWLIRITDRWKIMEWCESQDNRDLLFVFHYRIRKFEKTNLTQSGWIQGVSNSNMLDRYMFARNRAIAWIFRTSAAMKSHLVLFHFHGYCHPIELSRAEAVHPIFFRVCMWSTYFDSWSSTGWLNRQVGGVSLISNFYPIFSLHFPPVALYGRRRLIWKFYIHLQCPKMQGTGVYLISPT